MRASGGDCHLIMIDNGGFFLRAGDLDTIRKYCAAVPNCKFIVRLYHRNEGNWQNYPKASEYEANWRWVKSQLGALINRLILDSPFNEPNLAGDNATLAKPFVDYCVSLVQAAVNAGVKLAIGAFSVGTPHESLLKTVYLPLWRICARYGQGISIHAYGAAIPEIGELVSMDTVLDPVKSRAAMIDRKWDMKHAGYLMARFYRIIQIWQEFDLGTPEHPYPELYVTEGIIDNIFNSQTSTIKEEWRSKFGIVMFNLDPRGARTWERWLRVVFPELDFQQALKLIFRHARKNIFYHPAFKAICIFALNPQWDYGYTGHPNGTNKEAGSNFDRPEYAIFRNVYLSEINAEVYEDIPMPQFPLFPALIKSPVGSNIRSLPAGADIIGNTGILADWTECQLSKEFVPVSGSPYNWYEISIADKHGWIADTTPFEFQHIEEVPTERMYIVDIPAGGTQILPESVLDAMIEYQGLVLAGLKIIRNAPQ